MKMDLRTQNQRVEDKLKQIEDKLDKVVEMLEAKETVEKKSKKSDN